MKEVYCVTLFSTQMSCEIDLNYPKWWIWNPCVPQNWNPGKDKRDLRMHAILQKGYFVVYGVGCNRIQNIQVLIRSLLRSPLLFKEINAQFQIWNHHLRKRVQLVAVVYLFPAKKYRVFVFGIELIAPGFCPRNIDL